MGTFRDDTATVVSQSASTAKSHPTAAEAGFNLIEVAITTLIIGVFIASILTTMTSGYAVLDRSRETLRANQILQQELETIRTYSWTQMGTSSNFTGSTYTDRGITFSVNRSVTNYYNSTTYGSNNMKKVTVTVIWTNAMNQAITKSMTTVIAQGGLNDYIY